MTDVDLEAQKTTASRDQISGKDAPQDPANEGLGADHGSTHDETPPSVETPAAVHRRMSISSYIGAEGPSSGRVDAGPGPFPSRSRTSPTPRSHRSNTTPPASQAPPGSNTQAPGSPQASLSSSIEDEDEEIGLFDFAEELRGENPPGEPWFMEMTRLRRIHFLWLNRELAAVRKKILESKRVSDEDMRTLQSLLRDQAEAIRDFQYIRSLDFLSTSEMSQRRQQSILYFPLTARSVVDSVFSFETENYRCLPRGKTSSTFADGLRDLMRTYLPPTLTWTNAEKIERPDLYLKGYAPTVLNPALERIARYAPPMVGALSILVPMYIMAINQNQTKNLVTTTVAVVLFALLCSAVLKVSNDQTLSATVGYAAVLTVFVGLTTGSGNGSSS